jgi:hypothetical protein
MVTTSNNTSDIHFFPASLAHSLSHPANFPFSSLTWGRRETPLCSHSLGGPSKGPACAKVDNVGDSEEPALELLVLVLLNQG